MGMETAVAGAALGLDFMGQRQQRKAAENMNEAQLAQAAQRRADIERYGREALGAIGPGYEAARGVYGQLQDRIPGQISRTMVPQMDISQQASMMGQGTALAGTQQALNALMGRPVDLAGLRPQGFDIDYQQLAQSTQMQPLDLSGLSKLSGLGGRANMPQITPSQQDYLRNMQMMNYGMQV